MNQQKLLLSILALCQAFATANADIRIVVHEPSSFRGMMIHQDPIQDMIRKNGCQTVCQGLTPFLPRIARMMCPSLCKGIEAGRLSIKDLPISDSVKASIYRWANQQTKWAKQI